MNPTRRSYRALSRLPAYGLYRPDGELLATVRASDIHEARELLREVAPAQREGLRVRNVDARHNHHHKREGKPI